MIRGREDDDMNCRTCSYRYECASADICPEWVECAVDTGIFDTLERRAEIINLDEYRQQKKLYMPPPEAWEDKLFGRIDAVLDRMYPWVIGTALIYLAYHLLRWWLG